jgi:hypothetical protein
MVEITQVSQTPSSGELSSYLDGPAPGAAADRTTIEIWGWAYGRRDHVREVEVCSGHDLIRAIPVAVPRPDVRAAHPDASETSGFWSLCGTLGLERDFTLTVRAVMTDGTRLEIGSITGRRRPVTTSFEPRLQPLLVSSLGRSGTTLLMGLLSALPAIVSHRTYPYEIFPARYWLHLLRVLAEPADHTRSSHPSTFADDIWRVGYNPFHTAPVTQDSAFADLLGGSYVERLARFCQQSIDDFYATAAELQEQQHAAHFAEKFQPDRLPRIAWELYPDAKEIVLVRDFRDLICSVFAFNERRGTVDFGRDGFESDGDYVRYVGRRARQLLEAWKSRRDRAELVRYEDLAARPVETVERLLAYLKVESSPATAESLVRAAFDRPEVGQHRTSSTVAGSIGRWKDELPPSLRPVAAESLDGVLLELGYEAS